MPKLNALQQKYGKQGFVVLAIHSDPNTEAAKKLAKELKMGFPVGFDDGSYKKQLGCDSFPDYVLIDRKGILRANDLANSEIERAVTALLAETAQ